MTERTVIDWTFSELQTYVTRELFDALIKGGTREMRGQFFVVYNVICQWQEGQR